MKFLKKKHLLVKHPRYQYIQSNKMGYFSIYFKSVGIIKFNQYKAIIFFLKKKLKPCGKMFLRMSNSIKDTKKPIGVRMGKGKGSLNDFYILVYPGKILVEFFFRESFYLKTPQNFDFFTKINNIVFLLNKKMGVEVGLLQSANDRLKIKY